MSKLGIDNTSSNGFPRIELFDFLRGVALIAMIIYHFSWDLQFFNLLPTGAIEAPAWKLFARTIAASFLTLVGISLYLAHGKNFNRKGFLKRLIMVAGAALLITIATYFSFPENYIFFGILHCIAISSIIALSFLRLPAIITLVAAITIFAIASTIETSLLNSPYLFWLGLGNIAPNTNDYEPLFPWLGFTLLGVGIAQILAKLDWLTALSEWQFNNPISRGLKFLGRNSLITYLVHQPIMIALLYGVITIFGLQADPKQMFLENCIHGCQANASKAQCESFCPCVTEGFEANGDFQDILSGKLNFNEHAASQKVINQCSIESQD